VHRRLVSLTSMSVACPNLTIKIKAAKVGYKEKSRL
jgi:hypothetical protein